MKNKLIIFIFLLFIIIPVKADLTEDQAKSVASFAEGFVKEGNSHLSAKGFSLLSYSQGQNRYTGFNGVLVKISSDYNHSNKNINEYKLTFDCASFASFIYYHVLGFHTYNGTKDKKALLVKEFVSKASNKNEFYFIFRNKEVPKADYSLVKEGDLLVFEGSHIMVSLGGKRFAHCSVSEIKEGGPLLGCNVEEDITTFYKDRKLTVIRALDTTATPNTTYTWPDTNETKDYSYDKEPSIEISTKTITKSSETIEIKLTDDVNLVSYKINDKTFTITGKTQTIEYELTENMKYTITVTDSKNHTVTKEYTVTDLDKTNPVISNINCNYIGNNVFEITVTATDDSNLTYSIDGTNYQESNTFTNLNIGTYTIYVKDEGNNIINQSYTIDSSLLKNLILEYSKELVNELEIKVSNQNTNIKSYGIGTTKNNITFKDISESTKITQNGTYIVASKDNNDLITYQELVISNIDNINPVVTNVEVVDKGLLKTKIKVNATDNSDTIYYSIDNTNYSESNILEVKNNQKIYVKDKAGNILEYTVNLDTANISEDTSNDFDIVTIILIIGIVVTGLVLIYVLFGKGLFK